MAVSDEMTAYFCGQHPKMQPQCLLNYILLVLFILLLLILPLFPLLLKTIATPYDKHCSLLLMLQSSSMGSEDLMEPVPCLVWLITHSPLFPSPHYHYSVQPGDVQDHDRNVGRIL